MIKKGREGRGRSSPVTTSDYQGTHPLRSTEYDSTIQCTVWYVTVLYNMVRYTFMRYNMVCCGMEGYGMVRYGMVGDGSVWYGIVYQVLCNMVWYGTVRFTTY